ncbi:MAG: hypothetical protein HY925_03015 [Elusimicrobia bacterium]|nr:hypothetical protein [Elusimicrobiota bacterium]
MPCPNCQAETPAGATDCAACGVVFEKWLKRQQNVAAASTPALPPDAAGSAAPGPEAEEAFDKTIPLIAGGVAAAIFVVFALMKPSGQPVPASATVLSGGFALKVPDGWTVKPVDCDGAKEPCTAATISKEDDPAAAAAEASGGFPLGVTATVFPDGPRAGSATDEQLDATYLAGWKGQLDRFNAGPRERIEVDGLRGVRLSANGPKHERVEIRKPLILKEAQAVAELRKRNPGKSVISYEARMSGKPGDFIPEVVVDPGEYREGDYEIALEAMLVSGRGHTLLLSCRAQLHQTHDCDSAIDDFAKNVRVVDRPRRLDVWLGKPAKAP